jgi:hypothetical protein
MPNYRLFVRAAAGAVATASLLGSSAALAAPGAQGTRARTAVAQTGILPPHHPSRNLAPSPDFLAAPACYSAKDWVSCDTEVLRAITRARSVLEHMGGMSFSLAAYRKLSHIEQLFVTVNLERVARGLSPAAVLTRSLDTIAQAGARNDGDPPLSDLPTRLPGGGRWISAGGNWAGGFRNPLGSNYGWMYDDSGSRWGHRDNILGRYASRTKCGGSPSDLAMGAGYIGAGKKYGDSETELLVGVCGPAPTDVIFRWTTAVRLLHVKP